MVKNPIAFFFVICNSYSVTDAYNVTGSSFDQHQPGARISIQSSTCTFASIGASKPPNTMLLLQKASLFLPTISSSHLFSLSPTHSEGQFCKGQVGGRLNISLFSSFRNSGFNKLTKESNGFDLMWITRMKKKRNAKLASLMELANYFDEVLESNEVEGDGDDNVTGI